MKDEIKAWWTRDVCPFVKSPDVTLGNHAFHIGDCLVVLSETTKGFDFTKIFCFNIQLNKWTVLNCETVGEDFPTGILIKPSAAVKQNRIYLYGGVKTDGQTCSDLFELDCNTMTWSVLSLTTPENEDNSRAGHTLTYVPDQGLFVIGGFRKWLSNGILRECYCDSILRINPSVSSIEVLRTLSEGAPSPREGHSCTVMSNEKTIFVYGGTDGRSSFNDCHVFDCRTLIWVDMPAGPVSVAYHGAALVSGRIVIFGGMSFEMGESRLQTKSDIFAYDLNAWKRISMKPIDGRAIHAVVGVPKRLYVFGGYCTTRTEEKYLNNEMVKIDFDRPDQVVRVCVRSVHPQCAEFEVILPPSADYGHLQIFARSQGMYVDRRDSDQIKVVSLILNKGLEVLDDVWIESNHERIRRIFLKFLINTYFARDACNAHSDNSSSDDESGIITNRASSHPHRTYKMTPAERKAIREEMAKRSKKTVERTRYRDAHGFESSSGAIVPEMGANDPDGEHGLIRFSCIGKADIEARNSFRRRTNFTRELPPVPPPPMQFRPAYQSRIPLVHEWPAVDERGVINDASVVGLLNNSAGLMQPGFYNHRPGAPPRFFQPYEAPRPQVRFRSVISADWQNMSAGGGINVRRLVEGRTGAVQRPTRPPSPVVIDLTLDDSDDDDKIPQIDGSEIIVLDESEEEDENDWMDACVFDTSKFSVHDFWLEPLDVPDSMVAGRLSDYLKLEAADRSLPVLKPNLYRTLECRRPGRWNLEADTEYSVRVRAINAAGCGPFSEVVQFRTPPLLIPSRRPKVKASCVEEGAFKVQWTSVQRAERYTLFLIVPSGRESSVRMSFEETARLHLKEIYTGNDFCVEVKAEEVRHGLLKSWRAFANGRITGYGFAVRGESENGSGPLGYAFCRLHNFVTRESSSEGATTMSSEYEFGM